MKIVPNPGLRKQKNTVKTSVADIGNIVKEVQELIAKDPDIKADKNIQNILIQVAKYRTENESNEKTH